MEKFWDYKTRGYLKRNLIDSDPISLEVQDKFTLILTGTSRITASQETVKDLLAIISSYEHIKTIIIKDLNDNNDAFLIQLFATIVDFHQLNELHFTFSKGREFTGNLSEKTIERLGDLIAKNKAIKILNADNICQIFHENNHPILALIPGLLECHLDELSLQYNGLGASEYIAIKNALKPISTKWSQSGNKSRPRLDLTHNDMGRNLTNGIWKPRKTESALYCHSTWSNRSEPYHTYMGPMIFLQAAKEEKIESLFRIIYNKEPPESIYYTLIYLVKHISLHAGYLELCEYLRNELMKLEEMRSGIHEDSFVMELLSGLDMITAAIKEDHKSEFFSKQFDLSSADVTKLSNISQAIKEGELNLSRFYAIWKWQLKYNIADRNAVNSFLSYNCKTDSDSKLFLTISLRMAHDIINEISHRQNNMTAKEYYSYFSAQVSLICALIQKVYNTIGNAEEPNEIDISFINQLQYRNHSELVVLAEKLYRPLIKTHRNTDSIKERHDQINSAVLKLSKNLRTKLDPSEFILFDQEFEISFQTEFNKLYPSGVISSKTCSIEAKLKALRAKPRCHKAYQSLCTSVADYLHNHLNTISTNLDSSALCVMILGFYAMGGALNDKILNIIANTQATKSGSMPYDPDDLLLKAQRLRLLNQIRSFVSYNVDKDSGNQSIARIIILTRVEFLLAIENNTFKYAFDYLLATTPERLSGDSIKDIFIEELCHYTKALIKMRNKNTIRLETTLQGLERLLSHNLMQNQDLTILLEIRYENNHEQKLLDALYKKLKQMGHHLAFDSFDQNNDANPRNSKNEYTPLLSTSKTNVKRTIKKEKEEEEGHKSYQYGSVIEW